MSRLQLVVILMAGYCLLQAVAATSSKSSDRLERRKQQASRQTGLSVRLGGQRVGTVSYPGEKVSRVTLSPWGRRKDDLHWLDLSEAQVSPKVTLRLRLERAKIRSRKRKAQRRAKTDALDGLSGDEIEVEEEAQNSPESATEAPKEAESVENSENTEKVEEEKAESVEKKEKAEEEKPEVKGDTRDQAIQVDAQRPVEAQNNQPSASGKLVIPFELLASELEGRKAEARQLGANLARAQRQLEEMAEHLEGAKRVLESMGKGELEGGQKASFETLRAFYMLLLNKDRHSNERLKEAQARIEELESKLQSCSNSGSNSGRISNNEPAEVTNAGKEEKVKEEQQSEKNPDGVEGQHSAEEGQSEEKEDEELERKEETGVQSGAKEPVSGVQSGSSEGGRNSRYRQLEVGEIGEKLISRMASNSTLEERCLKYFVVRAHRGRVNNELMKTVARLSMPTLDINTCTASQQFFAELAHFLRQLTETTERPYNKWNQMLMEDLQKCIHLGDSPADEPGKKTSKCGGSFCPPAQESPKKQVDDNLSTPTSKTEAHKPVGPQPEGKQRSSEADLATETVQDESGKQRQKQKPPASPEQKQKPPASPEQKPAESPAPLPAEAPKPPRPERRLIPAPWLLPEPPKASGTARAQAEAKVSRMDSSPQLAQQTMPRPRAELPFGRKPNRFSFRGLLYK